MTDEPTPIQSRRTPVVVDVVGTDGKDHKFEAVPLAWRDRNQLGALMVQEYTNATNKAITFDRDEAGTVTGVHIQFAETLIDYPNILALAFPKYKAPDFDICDFQSLIEVLTAALKVNGLERQVYMLDLGKGRSENVFQTAGLAQPEPSGDGAKTEPTPD